jgi:hypothetical protein
MPVKLTNTADHVPEGGVCGITAAFTDEAGDAVAPATLTWTLTDTEGAVINNRSDVAVNTPESSETIVLSGNDLGITAAEKAATDETFVLRVLTIEGTYNSSLGSGLPIRDQVTFAVDIMAVDHDGN